MTGLKKINHMVKFERMKKGILYFTCILLFSCHSSTDPKKIVKEWHGKEIQIPSGNMELKVLGRDTICPDVWNKPYKIFTYIDSIGCTSCQLGLAEWKVLIDSCRQQQLDVSFLFAVHSNDYRHFGSEVRFHEFNYPIIYDYHNDFDKINHFPPAPYRTFLLDKNNKVLLVGSPVRNPKIWELYLEIMTSTL